MTKAQYIRWANRREEAAQCFRDAIAKLRDACEVSESSELTALHGGVAEDLITYAIGSAQGGIALLLQALEAMEQEVRK